MTLLSTLTKNSLLLSTTIVIGLFSTAHAQTSVSGTVLGDVTIGNDLRFRGLSYTAQKPSVQANLEYGVANGFYLGTYWANVSERVMGNANSRIDLYGGFRGDFAPFGVDFGTRYQSFPGSESSYLLKNVKKNKASLHELYFGVTWEFLTIKMNRALSKYYGVAGTSGSSYIEINAQPEIAPNLRLLAHAGYQKIKGFEDGSYSDYALGFSMKLNRTYSLSLAGVGSNAKKEVYNILKTDGSNLNIGKPGLVLTLSAQF